MPDLERQTGDARIVRLEMRRPEGRGHHPHGARVVAARPWWRRHEVPPAAMEIEPRDHLRIDPGRKIVDAAVGRAPGFEPRSKADVRKRPEPRRVAGQVSEQPSNSPGSRERAEIDVR